MEKNVLLIIPAYNEEMNIGQVLDDLTAAGVREKMDIVVINDGSKDYTAEVVKARGIPVIHQIFNMGYGAALQSGYKYASDHEYQYLLQMDADGQHDLRTLDVILDRLTGKTPPAVPQPDSVEEGRIPDIIIGSRFLEGAESFKISGLKAFAIKFFNSVISMITGYHLTDPTSGLQGLNRKAFTYYARFSNFDIQYPDLNMIVQMLLRGYHIEEVPAIMHERTAGVSMHTGLWNAGKYMLIMFVSTLNVYNQNHKLKKKAK